jgi:hypothetical protein
VEDEKDKGRSKSGMVKMKREMIIKIKIINEEN